MAFKDLTGQRFGRLVALRVVGKAKKGESIWECQCDCGNITNVVVTNLTRQYTRSCGCYQKEYWKLNAGYCITTYRALYGVWQCLNRRCYDPKSQAYKHYGERGIGVCDEWRNNFRAFFDWSIANGYKVEKLPNGRNKWTIDRIDNDKGYSPENCRWTDIKTQANNTSQNRFITINGVTKTMHQWADFCGYDYWIITNRYYKGIRGEELLKPPKRRKKK